MIRSVLALLVTQLVCSLAFAKGTGNTEECLSSKKRYFANARVQLSCEPYVHIYHSNAPVTPPNRGALMIGQFNVLRLGEESSQFKDFGLLAKIINQWDIVGAVELTPTKEDVREHNNEIEDLNNELYRNSFLIPGHIRLLLALQILDPSWSLIMSPEARGEGSSGELAGFYYRASLVKPAPNKYCTALTGKLLTEGCTARFAPNIDPLISRPPFIATFQTITKRMYTLVTSHLRFDASNAEEQALLKLYPGDCSRCPKKDEFQARFAEARATSVLVSQLQRSENHTVIWGGDFNFSPADAEGLPLNYILGPLQGAKMLNTSLTSLAKETGLTSSYDHFVLGRTALNECDPNSVAVFDFRNPQLLPEVGTYQARAETLFLQYKALWASQVSVTKKGKVRPLMTAAKLRDALDDFNKWIRSPQAPNVLFRAILSDHLPISMACRLN